tara:strand:- start:1562 stop:2353 length:792 start_codon:yes stop_codon:yes gene_type:complete
MKNFKDEFERYYDKIKNHEPFAFSRWADGELWILEDKFCPHGTEWSLSPTSYGYLEPEDQKHFDATQHGFHKEKLWDAFRYDAPNYHIGITTASDSNILAGVNPRDWMIENSGSDIDNITYANLFINSNYRQFRERIIPLFSEYDTTILCNERCDISIPHKKDFRVGSNCIVNDDDKIEEMVDYVKHEKPEGQLFLFCASSLGNCCIHRLHEVAPNNTYLDMGSALNPDLKLGIDRGYLSAWAGVKQRGLWDMSVYLEREETW